MSIRYLKTAKNWLWSRLNRQGTDATGHHSPTSWKLLHVRTMTRGPVSRTPPPAPAHPPGRKQVRRWVLPRICTCVLLVSAHACTVHNVKGTEGCTPKAQAPFVHPRPEEGLASPTPAPGPLCVRLSSDVTGLFNLQVDPGGSRARAQRDTLRSAL